MSSHQLHAIQILHTFLHTISRKPEPQVTQNVQNQTARMSDAIYLGLRGPVASEGW